MSGLTVTLVVTSTNERDGWIHPALAMFLLDWSRTVRGAIRVVFNYRPFHNARNRAVELFKQNKTDFLFLVDNDTVPPHGLDRVLEVIGDRDIVSIPYPLYRLEGGDLSVFDCVFRQDSESSEPKPFKLKDSGFQEIAACGMGATFIHRRVIEGMQSPYFRAVDSLNSPLEDIDFCFRARGAGFKVCATLDFGRAEHYKTVPLGCFGAAIL